MKRIIALSFSLSAILLYQPLWAQEQVYCPAEVNCAQDGPAAACTFDQHARGYWNDPAASSVLAGQYILSYVSAPYHSRDPGYAICVYTHTDVYRTVSLYAKPASNLARDEAPAWRANESWWECKPEAAASCPLFEEDALYIQNNRRNAIIVTPGPITVNPGQYTRLFMDDFDDCPNSDVCEAEVYTLDEQIGAVSVDLQNHLEIVDIVDNIDVRSEIIKIDTFNAVEVK